jgi:hypothetical protein
VTEQDKPIIFENLKRPPLANMDVDPATPVFREEFRILEPERIEKLTIQKTFIPTYRFIRPETTAESPAGPEEESVASIQPPEAPAHDNTLGERFWKVLAHFPPM